MLSYIYILKYKFLITIQDSLYLHGSFKDTLYGTQCPLTTDPVWLTCNLCSTINNKTQSLLEH